MESVYNVVTKLLGDDSLVDKFWMHYEAEYPEIAEVLMELGYIEKEGILGNQPKECVRKSII